jgi:hypothetical protein
LSPKKRKHRSGNFVRRHDSSSTWMAQQLSSRDGPKGYYMCDICGSNVPGLGGAIPLCPRCMIPMLPMEGVNPNARQGGPPKQSFDYSSRIYFPTDGHPQYIGLPMGHPDPDDEPAMNAYRSRRSFDRSDRRGPNPQSAPDGQRRQNNRFRPKHQGQGPQQKPSGDQGSRQTFRAGYTVNPHKEGQPGHHRPRHGEHQNQHAPSSASNQPAPPRPPAVQPTLPEMPISEPQAVSKPAPPEKSAPLQVQTAPIPAIPKTSPAEAAPKMLQPDMADAAPAKKPRPARSRPKPLATEAAIEPSDKPVARRRKKTASPAADSADENKTA